MTLDALLVEAQARGFLGPSPVARQLAHSSDLGRALGEFEGRFLDLGSGAGIPGLVLAERFTNATAVLLDSQRKRCEFLWMAIQELGLEDRCSVLCGRAEELARDRELRGTFDLVVARAFGPPATTAECAVGFLARGGRLAVSEPPAAPTMDTRWPTLGLSELGFSRPHFAQSGDASLAVMVLSTIASERWPRRVGVPTKRPLW